MRRDGDIGKTFSHEKEQAGMVQRGWGRDQDRRQHVTGGWSVAQKGCEEVGRELGGRWRETLRVLNLGLRKKKSTAGSSDLHHFRKRNRAMYKILDLLSEIFVFIASLKPFHVARGGRVPWTLLPLGTSRPRVEWKESPLHPHFWGTQYAAGLMC